MTDESIGRDLGRIEGKLDAFMSTLREHTERMNRIDENHEQLADKVSDTTKKMYLVTTVGGVIWAAITAYVAKHFL